MLPEFDRQWLSMGLTDADLTCLQETLLFNPRASNVIQQTGGLRKLRFALPERGKCGSARVVYIDFAEYKKLYLITAYPKKEKDNLSSAEHNVIKKLIGQLETQLKGRGEPN